MVPLLMIMGDAAGQVTVYDDEKLAELLGFGSPKVDVFPKRLFEFINENYPSLKIPRTVIIPTLIEWRNALKDIEPYLKEIMKSIKIITGDNPLDVEEYVNSQDFSIYNFKLLNEEWLKIYLNQISYQIEMLDKDKILPYDDYYIKLYKIKLDLKKCLLYKTDDDIKHIELKTDVENLQKELEQLKQKSDAELSEASAGNEHENRNSNGEESFNTNSNMRLNTRMARRF